MGYSSYLDFHHWCWGTECKSEWRKGHNGTERDVGWEREREERKGERERGGWWDRGGGGGPRSSGTQGAHRQWGNNDMKEASWRSHTALAHLRRRKISWPLHTDTHTHAQTLHACMQTHTLADAQRKTHSHSGKRWTQPEAPQQREVSYEQNIWTQLSSQLCLHWLTFSARVPKKHNALQTRASLTVYCKLWENCTINPDMMALKLKCLDVIAMEMCKYTFNIKEALYEIFMFILCFTHVSSFIQASEPACRVWLSMKLELTHLC